MSVPKMMLPKDEWCYTEDQIENENIRVKSG